MGEANKVVSLLIGLFVVIVIFSVIASRLGLSQKLRSLQNKTDKNEPVLSVTPTPSQKIIVQKQITTGNQTTSVKKIPVINQEASQINTYKPLEKGETTNNGVVSTTKGDVTKIPETGASIFLIPFAISGLLGGAYLRKSK